MRGHVGRAGAVQQLEVLEDELREANVEEHVEAREREVVEQADEEGRQRTREDQGEGVLHHRVRSLQARIYHAHCLVLTLVELKLEVEVFFFTWNRQ